MANGLINLLKNGQARLKILTPVILNNQLAKETTDLLVTSTIRRGIPLPAWIELSELYTHNRVYDESFQNFPTDGHSIDYRLLLQEETPKFFPGFGQKKKDILNRGFLKARIECNFGTGQREILENKSYFLTPRTLQPFKSPNYSDNSFEFGKDQGEWFFRWGLNAIPYRSYYASDDHPSGIDSDILLSGLVVTCYSNSKRALKNLTLKQFNYLYRGNFKIERIHK